MRVLALILLYCSLAAAQTPVTPGAAITKGTQGTNGFTTQELKNAGRTYVTLSAQLITGVTTEALATFTKNVGGTATATQTAYTITNGKTFVIQAISFQVKNTTTTANNLTLNVRVGGSVSATSPLVLSGFCSAASATATNIGAGFVEVTDGIQIVGDGTLQIGISHLENAATASITSFILVGYEY